MPLMIPADLIEAENEPCEPVLAEAHAMLGDDYAYVPSERSDGDLLMDALKEKYLR